MAASMHELVAKAKRIVSDYEGNVLPFKILEMKHARRTFSGVLLESEPHSTREKAVGISELKRALDNLTILLDRAQQTDDMATLAGIVKNIENIAKNTDDATPAELAQSRRAAYLTEEAMLLGLDGTDLKLLQTFAADILPRGKAFVLPTDETDDGIYIGNGQAPLGGSAAIGAIATKHYRLEKGAGPSEYHFPILQAGYDAKTGLYCIDTLKIWMVIPGAATRLDPTEHLGKIFEAARLDQKKFADMLLNLMMDMGATKSAALDRLNRPESYSFTYRTGGPGIANPGTGIVEYKPTMEAAFYAGFGKPTELGSYHVEARVTLPEAHVRITAETPMERYDDHSAHWRLQLADAQPDPRMN